MKTLFAYLALCLLFATTTMAQSDSFLTLKEKFSGSHDVFCFGTNGFLARTVLHLAGEHEFTHAVKDIHSIRLITVPMEAFRQQRVTLPGFKHVLSKDAFEELASVKDGSDHVTVYLKSTKDRDNRYMVLVEEPDEVVVIEIQGYIDPNLILNYEKSTRFNQ